MMRYLKNHPVILGVLLAFVQTIIFSSLGVIVQILSAEHHAMDMMLYRNIISLLGFSVILSFMQGGWKKVRRANLKRQIVRSIVGTLTMVGTFATFSYLSLSEAQSLFYAGPLFALLLSYPLLKEKVGPYRFGAAIVGFIGVILVTQPANISSLIGGALGIATAIGFAGVMICLRWLGKTEDAIVTAFYFALFGLIIVLPFQPLYWTAPSTDMLLYLCGLGVLAIGVQITLTKAYFLAPPSIVSPVTYLSIFWSILLDYMIRGQWPLWGTILGAALIILSNVFIIYREVRSDKGSVKLSP